MGGRRFMSVAVALAVSGAGAGVASAWPTGAPAHRAPTIAAAPVRLSMDPVGGPDGGSGWPAVPLIAREALDTAPLLDEDRSHPDNDPLRVGIDRPLALVITPRTAGVWQDNGDGSWTWRLRLSEPGAEAVRVWFEDVRAIAGRTITVGDAQGRYAERLDAGACAPGRSLWSSAIPGETALVELTVPGAAMQDAPAFRVGGTSNIYHPSFAPGAPAGVALRDTCDRDVACETTDAVARDSVGRLSFSRNGTQYLCSGALLADVDPRDDVPFFLTAAHCLSTQDVADSVTVYWFYQRQTCGGEGPPLSLTPRTSGAALLATSSGSDTTLLLLAQPIVDGQGFAAWTAEPLESDGVCVGIHHPGGGLKEYSRGQRDASPLNCSGLGPTNFYYGHWTVGITEGGSSGSPLFDSQWRVVGQLFGKCCPVSCALADCTNRGQWNFVYGRLDAALGLLAPFIARCPADFNRSGQTSVQDIFDFLASYFAADPEADFNRSGMVGVQDIFDFLEAYFTPCAG